MASDLVSDQTAKQLREAWFRYLDTIEAIRPALYRFCRRMTGDIWETQDLLAGNFTEGIRRHRTRRMRTARIASQRSARVSFSIATNLWIDQLRRSQMRIEVAASEPLVSPEQAVAAREAVAVLLARASLCERAALVLKDVFDFSLENIAQMLSTTVGAIKSALHRGRASSRSRSP